MNLATGTMLGPYKVLSLIGRGGMGEVYLACGLVLLFVGATGTLAQYRFDYWTTDNGLPQNEVAAITQTPDGSLWFATNDGLVRYDGVRFTVFDQGTSNGLRSNRFLSTGVEPQTT